MARCRAVAAALLIVLATGCGGSSGSEAAAPTKQASPLWRPPSPVGPDPAAPLTQVFTTTVFKPAMTIRLPADWTPVERDAAAFQAFFGTESNELTLDHSYRQRESVSTAMTRLAATDGLEPGPMYDVSMGGRKGRGFVGKAPKGVEFKDSTFHIPVGPIEVMAVPMTDGTTLTVFVTDNVGGGLTSTSQLARRILAGVTWR